MAARNTPMRNVMNKALSRASNPGINPIDTLLTTTPGSGSVGAGRVTNEQGQPLFQVGKSKVGGPCVVK